MSLAHKIRDFLMSQKYYLDLGAVFLNLINFGLLLIALRTQITSFFHVDHYFPNVTIVILIVGYLGIWSGGVFLDKVMVYQPYLEKVGARHGYLWNESFSKLDAINEKVTRLEARFNEQKD